MSHRPKDKIKKDISEVSIEGRDKRMSATNVKKLKNAYRHPFEYISPLLYRKKEVDFGVEIDEVDSDY